MSSANPAAAPAAAAAAEAKADLQRARIAVEEEEDAFQKLPSPLAITEIVKSLGMDTSVYPIINKVVVARNFNSNIAKRLLFDFLDIYSKEFYEKIVGTNFQNNIYEFKDNSSVTPKTYYIDLLSSGIFEKIPNDVNKKTGENIEEFARVIQTLCENVPINIDVRGLFSGITNSSTVQQKALCKMRLASMILGKNFVPTSKNPELTYYQFNPNSDEMSNTERIVCWGYGTCEPDDDGTKNIYTEKFNFKITKYDTDTQGTNMYIVSVSSASSTIEGNVITLLPLPDYFIQDISSANVLLKSSGVVTNCLASPDHCIGFSRNGVYNVKFVITQGQYNAFKNNKTNIPVKFMCDSSGNPFTFTSALPTHKNRSVTDPFPNVLWYISGKPIPPPVTKDISGTTINSASTGGTISSINTPVNVKEKGVYYSTTTILNNVSGANKQPANSGDTAKDFTCNLTGLSADTKYNVRAFVLYDVNGRDVLVLGGNKIFNTSPNSGSGGGVK